MKNTDIRFLFDIGVVLLNIHYENALERIAPLCDLDQGTGGRDFFHLAERDPMMAEFERGCLNTEDFFRHFAAKARYHGTFEQFRDIWCSIFSENKPMIDFARELAKTHDIYFVTNTGPLHVPLIYDLYPSLKFFKDDAASCYIGAVKPEPEFYERALKKFGLQAAECVLLDDRPENVEGARAVGIRSILYENPDQAIRAIRQLLAD
jgi:FMN phosphatase YigB (HAD superfamily)